MKYIPKIKKYIDPRYFLNENQEEEIHSSVEVMVNDIIKNIPYISLVQTRLNMNKRKMFELLVNKAPKDIYDQRELNDIVQETKEDLLNYFLDHRIDAKDEFPDHKREMLIRGRTIDGEGFVIQGWSVIVGARLGFDEPTKRVVLGVFSLKE